MSPPVLSTVSYAWQVLNKYSIFHPVAKVILPDINQLSLPSSQSFSGFLPRLEYITKFLPGPRDLDPGHLSHLSRPLLSFGSRKTPNMPPTWDLLHGSLPAFPQISGHVSPSHQPFPAILFKTASLTILTLFIFLSVLPGVCLCVFRLECKPHDSRAFLGLELCVPGKHPGARWPSIRTKNE